MFSMAALVTNRPLERAQLASSQETLARLSSLGVLQGTSALANDDADGASEARLVALGWPELERVLPDRGLPRGVVEIASPMTSSQGASAHASLAHLAMKGGATSIALAAIRAAHEADPNAWCAWVTESTAPALYAPAAAQAGVDLDRLLVVRPDHASLARTVVKVAAAGAFELVIVDAPTGLDGRLPASANVEPTASKLVRAAGGRLSRVDGSVIVRKLALASEEKGTGFLLLTNMYTPRAVPWPVAMRLEVERRPDSISVRVTKDRRGRASSQHVVRISA